MPSPGRCSALRASAPTAPPTARAQARAQGGVLPRPLVTSPASLPPTTLSVSVRLTEFAARPSSVMTCSPLTFASFAWSLHDQHKRSLWAVPSLPPASPMTPRLAPPRPFLLFFLFSSSGSDPARAFSLPVPFQEQRLPIHHGQTFTPKEESNHGGSERLGECSSNRNPFRGNPWRDSLPAASAFSLGMHVRGVSPTPLLLPRGHTHTSRWDWMPRRIHCYPSKPYSMPAWSKGCPPRVGARRFAPPRRPPLPKRAPKPARREGCFPARSSRRLLPCLQQPGRVPCGSPNSQRGLRLP